MSESWKHHTVTVEVEPQGEDEQPGVTVSFECTAPEDASCRTHPVRAVGPAWGGCDCEAWYVCDDHGPRDDGMCGLTADAPAHDTAGHLFESGQECWAKDWFANNAAEYDGPDGDEIGDYVMPTLARAGLVHLMFEGDYVQWSWHETTTKETT